MRIRTATGFCLALLVSSVPSDVVWADGRCPQECPTALFETADGEPIYSTAEIVQTITGTVAWDGREIGYSFFRNEAYPCGSTGLHNFLVMEPLDGPEVKNLWVLLPWGGAGYFDENETNPDEIYYTAGERPRTDGRVENGEAAPQIHLLEQQLRIAEGLVPTLAATGNYRFMIASTCDHDTLLGMGEHTAPSYFYPNNPYRPTDRVDGLLALMSAIEFTATERPTDLVFLHGTSAGAYGAYGAAYVFAQQGVLLNGLVLDSALATARFEEFYFDFPPEDGPCLSGQLTHPEIDLCQTREKIGPFFCDESLFAEATVFDAAGGPTFDVPLFDLLSHNDKDCCGQVEPWLDEAIALGGNCEYIHNDLATALAAKGDPLQRSKVYPGGDHVLTSRAGPWHQELGEWLEDVLATEPAAPWPLVPQ